MLVYEVRFAIEIDFDKTRSRPAEIFATLGSMTEAFYQLDANFAHSIDAKAAFDQRLDRLEEGSIVTWLIEQLIHPDDRPLGDRPSESAVLQYMDRARMTVLQDLEKVDRIDNSQSVVGIGNKIDRIADELGVKKSLAYKQPAALPLAQAIHDVADSANRLAPNEIARCIGGSGEAPIPRGKIVSLEAIRDDLTEQTLSHEIDMVLKVKKPDYLGQSRWEVKHGSHPIDLSIEDKLWMDRFHNKQVILTPGDAIRATVRVTSRYSATGELIDENYQALRIQEVIQGMLTDE